MKNDRCLRKRTTGASEFPRGAFSRSPSFPCSYGLRPLTALVGGEGELNALYYSSFETQGDEDSPPEVAQRMS